MPSNYLHRALGPGAHARALVRPGETVVWAGFARTHYYDIKRLTPVGEPKGSAVGRGLGAVGDFAGEVVSGMLGSENGPDKPPPADVVVFGPQAGCLAHQHLSTLPSISRGLLRLWVLTSQRLVVFTEQPPVDEPPSTEDSLLGKASRFGRGLAKVGRIITDTRTKFGDNVEGEPVAPKAFVPAAEIPGAQIAGVRATRVSLVDGSGIDFVRGVAGPAWETTTAESELKIVTKEVTGHWLRPGERLVLACAPINGYTGVLLDGELRLPHEPLGDVPEVKLGKLKWPRPADWTMRTAGADWADDPTVAFWAHATRPEQDAVRFADHFAHTRGDARLTLTSHRAAVVYPTRLLADAAADAARNPFTTFSEVPASSIRGLTAEPAGCGVPSAPVVRLDFTDGSTLLVRDPLTSRRLGT
ncbi:hypothetical protein [Amycolatopsis sp. YIM 10]|uniref:hypothetical protein n=1 Tax=Amycolatopsis sp. YIM 10 TaxID=2653857 RepID=UPI00129039DB|nr:hypothetical protein [Amycolatopsis sp. YIM 10]QFU85477.1 hypothetical protein YIM_01220 [Amycolatopsis sp. YIM 10]